MAHEWIEEHAGPLAARAERDLEALVAVSSPSGDAAAAEEVVAVATALAPAAAEAHRIPCSSAEHAPDLVLRVPGPGSRRLLLLGHLDTVVAHGAHVPPQRLGSRLRGSGTIDMKAGVALALGLLHALAGRPEVGEVVLLLVNDEEWRTERFAHVPRFDGFDACLCFEAGERDPDGREAVIVRRKAAGTIRVRAHGVSAHSGAAPDRGVNALLALAEVARQVAAEHDPAGPDRLTAVPTILRSGEALNVVPAAGELICDVRADRLAALRGVLERIPAAVGEARLEAELQREWPGMDARAAAAPVLERATAALGSPVVPAGRGGASDASHFAAAIPVTIDGLGARGGHAHHPDEFVDLDSLRPRAAVALAVADAVLGAG
ncbi:MAG: M20/M25/M40 family metallo-hydrolase [Solirubrobacteraceae bacterium]|nr:M20/M25/M40 family metallo-hydrolase [Solirubrobacteraceae bacterium]